MMRRLIFAAVSVLLLVNLAGCGTDLVKGFIKEYEDNKEGIHQELGELWDGFLEEANDWSESFATHSITKDQDLIGSRERGADNYVGTYEASYTQFDGEEYIFGGTTLKRKDGGNLYATYSLTVRSGEATLYWMEGDNKIVIADTSNEGIYEFTIHAGKNFIVLEGETFTGTLNLNVGQNSVSDDIATDFGRAQDEKDFYSQLQVAKKNFHVGGKQCCYFL